MGMNDDKRTSVEREREKEREREREREREKERESSSTPRYVTPPFGLILPNSFDLGSIGWKRCNNTSSL